MAQDAARLLLDVSIEWARLIQPVDPFEGICCSTLPVQFRLGLGDRPIQVVASPVFAKTGQDFALSDILSVDVTDCTSMALRIEIWLAHTWRRKRVVAVASVPWLLHLGRIDIGVAEIVPIDAWCGSTIIGKLHVRLALQPTGLAVQKWLGTLLAQLKVMMYDARWARYQQDTALKGPVCPEGHEMLATTKATQENCCSICDTEGHAPAHSWQEGISWRTTKQDVWLDAFYACRKCCSVGESCYYCSHCAAAFGGGRQLVCVEPDSETVDQLLKAGCGSLDLAQAVAERMWSASDAHKYLDKFMPPLHTASFPVFNAGDLDLLRMSDDAADDHCACSMEGLGELASWDSEGKRLSQKLSWLVKAGAPGCGTLVRVATRATLKTQLRTQKCAVDDILELLETLEEGGDECFAVLELSLSLLAWHGSRSQDFPEMARRLGQMRQLVSNPTNTVLAIWNKAGERVHEHILEKITNATTIDCETWFGLVSMLVDVDMSDGCEFSVGESMKTRHQLLLSTPPAIVEASVSLSETTVGRAKVANVVRFLCGVSAQINRTYDALEEECPGIAARRLVHVRTVLTDLPAAIEEHWPALVGDLLWPLDPMQR